MMFNKDDSWLELSLSNLDRTNLEKRYVEAILQPLLGSVPGKAKLYLKIEKQGEVFHGLLEIKAFRENYVGRCSARDVYSLVETLRKNLMIKIRPRSNSLLSVLGVSGSVFDADYAESASSIGY